MSQQSSFFPLFLSIDKKKILLVGGGKIARDKLVRLLDFTTDIKIIASKISSETLQVIKKNNLKYEEKSFHDSDIDGFDIIIVAVDDIKLQKHIYDITRDKKVLINSVDSKDLCDFIFGSYIKKDDLVISISTSGTSPSVAKYLKVFLEKSLPKNLSLFLKEIKLLREKLPKGKERMKLLDKKCKSFFDLVQ